MVFCDEVLITLEGGRSLWLCSATLGGVLVFLFDLK